MNPTAFTIEAIDLLANRESNPESSEDRSSNDLPARCPWDDWHPINDVAASMAG